MPNRNNFQSFRVRKLTGQTRIPYNRGLRVRGSPHPHDYGALLPPLAAESNDFPVMSEKSFRSSKFEVPARKNPKVQIWND
jgi:hypothetical protein